VTVVYGYRVGEVALSSPGPFCDDVEIVVGRNFDSTVRVPSAVSAGCHLSNCVRPIPSLDHGRSALVGAQKRFAGAVLPADGVLLREFGEFVSAYLDKHFVPLSPETDTSVTTWLASTNFPQWRRDELAKVWSETVDTCNPRLYQCKSFMKDEFYPEPKFPRDINSRHDWFKCRVGPIFSLIEKSVLAACPEFIKSVPVSERARKISELLFTPGEGVSATDYTAFESLFTRKLQAACEMRLYRHMSRHLDDGRPWYNVVRRTLLGRNTCKFKWFTLSVPAKRMSGEMCTSLGNGFTNLMVQKFAAWKHSGKWQGYVEGDDGIGRHSVEFDDSFYARLGLRLKIERHQELNTASFCGMIYDTEECVNVADPLKVLADFAWLPRKCMGMRRSRWYTLIRCKALSLKYQYAGCPVVQALADYGLRVTRSFDVRAELERRTLGSYQRRILLEAVDAPCAEVQVGMGTRLLVEKVFGLSVADQRGIEDYLNNLKVMQPLEPPILWPARCAHWFNHYSTYVFELPLDCVRNPTIDFPYRREWDWSKETVP